MGISGNANEIVSIPSSKQKRVQIIKLANGFIEEDLNDEPAPVGPKSKVVEQMEQEANEYRESQFR